MDTTEVQVGRISATPQMARPVKDVHAALLAA